jgi:hypothetical protein
VPIRANMEAMCWTEISSQIYGDSRRRVWNATHSYILSRVERSIRIATRISARVGLPVRGRVHLAICHTNVSPTVKKATLRSLCRL